MLGLALAETLFGMVGAASDAKRRRWLDRMRDYGRRLVERRHIFSDVHRSAWTALP